MPATCQVCVVCATATPTTANPHGNVNDPMGACDNCHSFACGHHGQRVSHKARFLCVQCDKVIALGSALAQAPQIAPAVAPFATPEPLAALYAEQSFEAFAANRALYGARFFWPVSEFHVVSVDGLDFSEAVRADPTVPATVTGLLAAAIVIRDRYRLPPDGYGDSLILRGWDGS